MNSLRLIHFCLLSILFLFTGVSYAGLTIEMEGGTPSRPLDMTFQIESDNLRIDMQETTMIHIGSEKKTIVLMPKQQKYMVVNPNMMPQGDQGDEDLDKTEVTRTGKTDVINGFNCTQVLIKSAKGHLSELWISQSGPPLAEFLKGVSSMNAAYSSKMGLKWMLFLSQNPDIASFPIRVISYDESNHEIARMTVKSFKQESIPDYVFAPPQGYTELVMPDMGSMMKGGGGQLSQEQIEQMKRMAEEMKKQMHQ